MKSMFNPQFNYFSKADELKRRIYFTLIALFIFRIGSYIPLPSINSKILIQITSDNSSTILGMLNMLSGGSLGRMSIFALAIMPYITSSIVIQLFTVLYKNFEDLKKNDDAGRKKIAKYTRYLTVILAMVQGLGIAVGLEKISHNNINLVSDPGTIFKFVTIITLTTGTIFLMWLSEQVNSSGIGNGSSLILFSGIVAGVPSSFVKVFELVRIKSINPLYILIFLILLSAILMLVIFVEKAQRKIVIQYPKRQIGNKIYGGENSYLPLKLNTAGVIPPIFASSVLLFPMTITKLQKSEKLSWLGDMASYLDHGKILYILIYITLIVFFSFFYTAIIFNPKDTAENLKKNNGLIPGRKPGKNTAEYIDHVLTRINVIGAIYIAFICAFPEIIMSKYSLPFYLSGTSILIVVNVIIDTISQIQTHLFAHQYEGLIKKSKLRERLK